MTNTPNTNQKKRKKRIRYDRVAILLVGIIGIFALIWGVFRFFNPLSIKTDRYIAEYGETFDPYGNIKSLFFDSKTNVTFQGDVDSNVLGEVEASYQYKNKTYPFTVEVKDTKGPDLVLKDIKTDTTQVVSQNDFIESVSDASEYNLRIDGDIYPGQSGKNQITITAKDSHGNTTTKTATLERTIDKKAPKIENFEEKVDLIQGDHFTVQQYKAVDDIDPDPQITVDSSQLNTDVPGNYTVNYTAIDRSGNMKTYKQTINIAEDPDFGKKVCYLTFDDGPSALTGDILKILKENDAKATFFVTAFNPESYGFMKDIVDDGHTIALHTYTHDYPTVYSSTEAYFKDLQDISNLVEQQTGVKADIIRFPGGSSNSISASYCPGIMSTLVQEVQNKGYAYFDWNIDSTDASANGVPVEQIVENSTAGIGMDDVVILMHDTDAKPTTAQALPQIIAAYRDAGYVFKPLTRRSAPVHHGVVN